MNYMYMYMYVYFTVICCITGPPDLITAVALLHLGGQIVNRNYLKHVNKKNNVVVVVVRLTLKVEAKSAGGQPLLKVTVFTAK